MELIAKYELIYIKKPIYQLETFAIKDVYPYGEVIFRLHWHSGIKANSHPNKLWRAAIVFMRVSALIYTSVYA